MRLLLSLLRFAFTLIVALGAFAYTAIEFPVTMTGLFANVKQVRDQISLLVLPDSYTAWISILLWPNLIVFAGFAMATHFARDLVRTLFNGGRFPSDPDSGASS